MHEHPPGGDGRTVESEFGVDGVHRIPRSRALSGRCAGTRLQRRRRSARHAGVFEQRSRTGPLHQHQRYAPRRWVERRRLAAGVRRVGITADLRRRATIRTARQRLTPAPFGRLAERLGVPQRCGTFHFIDFSFRNRISNVYPCSRENNLFLKVIVYNTLTIIYIDNSTLV